MNSTSSALSAFVQIAGRRPPVRQSRTHRQFLPQTLQHKHQRNRQPLPRLLFQQHRPSVLGTEVPNQRKASIEVRIHWKSRGSFSIPTLTSCFDYDAQLLSITHQVRWAKDASYHMYGVQRKAKMEKSKYLEIPTRMTLVNITMIQWKICIIITTLTTVEGRSINPMAKVPNIRTQIQTKATGGDDNCLID